MVTTAVAVIRPRTLHLLQPNEAEGTLLEDTVCDNLKRIRYWLNVTKLYVPIYAVVARWLYGFGGGKGWQPAADSVSSWLAWLKRHNADGSEAELLRVATEMKSALGVSKGQRELLLRERERMLGITQPIAKARLLSQAEYAVAQGDPSTPLTGGDPSVDKVAASGRSASLLNMDWMVRNCVGRGGSRYPPPFGYLDSYDTSDQAMVDREVRHAGVAVREKQLEQEKKRKEEMLKKIWIFMNRASDREQNVRYQRLRLAFAHFKARG